MRQFGGFGPTLKEILFLSLDEDEVFVMKPDAKYMVIVLLLGIYEFYYIFEGLDSDKVLNYNWIAVAITTVLLLLRLWVS